ncbi:tap domain-containingprotein [Fusarium austroafricanum]|uniref:Tap domain-containingprotein n=1 Tax=Fusarium austroafricanum TaxID=2364996 RepID=A0A8H4KU21_9HYPO|nr:tap domain-containingprotein [Fusarium austroafricanum]
MKGIDLPSRIAGRQKWRVGRYAAPAMPLILIIVTLICLAWLDRFPAVLPTLSSPPPRYKGTTDPVPALSYGKFPKASDPFRFIPCTNKTLPPSLHDPNPVQTWADSFDSDPENWSWGSSSHNDSNTEHRHTFAGRGIYLCGYLDLPLDYYNDFDTRIVRLAITKFQASGLALAHGESPNRQIQPAPGQKSNRTIVIEPGGPGGSGTGDLWEEGEEVSQRLSQGQFDVLGWDPRGVNASQPALSCYPDAADRDRWKLLRRKHREELADPIAHLRTVDAINNATFYACHELYGDLGRFLSTTSITLDLEEIRKALGEDEITGYLTSYGTAIGQTYASMFPDRVGRLIFDGTDNYKNYRHLGGFASYSLDNVTDAWRDGFLGGCIAAGPEHCALAKPPVNSLSGTVTLEDLEFRMERLFQSLLAQPRPGFTESGGPALITHSQLALMLYMTLYNPKSWPEEAQMLLELEAGNSTLAAKLVEFPWYHSPTSPLHRDISPEEYMWLVVCADSSDSPQPQEGLLWWDNFWSNMTDQSWLSASFRMSTVFPCRHFNTYWSQPRHIHRGDLTDEMKTPIIFIAGTYDPATPLRHAQKLAKEMGNSARLVIHHGYGHSSQAHVSNCTNDITRAYMLNGTLPTDLETHCYANQKPYLFRED